MDWHISEMRPLNRFFVEGTDNRKEEEPHFDGREGLPVESREETGIRSENCLKKDRRTGKFDGKENTEERLYVSGAGKTRSEYI